MREMVTLFRKVLFLSALPLFSMGVDFELDSLVSDANKTEKHLLLFLHKDGCGFCEKMMINLEDSNISKSIEKDFIFVDINRDDEETLSFKEYNGTTKTFLKKLDVDLYPTILFMNGESTFVYNVIGYRNTKKFSTILNYVKNRTYQSVTFEEYEDELLTDEE